MKNKFLSITLLLLFITCVNTQTKSQSATMPEYNTTYMQLKDALFRQSTTKTKEAAIIMKDKINKANIEDAKQLKWNIDLLTAIELSEKIKAQLKSFACYPKRFKNYLRTVA